MTPIKDTAHQQVPSVTQTQIWPKLAKLGLIALAYLLAVRIGLLFVARPEGVASIWPVSGLALAILLLNPKREWPRLLAVIFITNAAGNWSGGNSLSVSLGFALANTIEPVLCAWMMIYLCKSKPGFERPLDVFALVSVAIFINGLTALLGAAVPTLAFGAPFFDTWRVWWTADGLGMLLVTPLIVTWAADPNLRRFNSLRQMIEGVLLFFALTLFAWLLFGPFTVAEKPLLRTYMLFPFLIWLAFRFRPRDMAAGLLLITFIAVLNTLQGFGILAFASQIETEHLVSLQSFLFVASFSGLLASAMVSEHKRNTEALSAAEANYLVIFEHAPVGFFQFSASGRFLNVNPMMAQIFGFASPAEMLASVTDIASQIYKDSAKWDEFQHLIAEQGQIFEFVNQNYRKDGSCIWTTSNVRVVRDSEGDIHYYEGFMRDISERIQAQEALRESEEHYRRIVDTAYEGIWVVDSAYQTTFLNARMEALLGYPVDEVLGKRVDAFLFETDQADTQQINRHLHHLGGQQERRFRRKDGSELWALVSAKPMVDDQNIFKGSFAMFSDITDRKQAEDALRESDEQFRTLATLAPVGIYLTDPDGNCLYANPAWCKLAGLSLEEALGQGWVAGLHPDDRALVSASWQKMVESHGQWGLEYRFQDRDGKIATVYGMAASQTDLSGRVTRYVGVNHDLTERKQAEAEVQKSKALYQDLVETAQDLIWQCDLEGSYVYLNPAWEAVLGYPLEEMLGRPFSDFQSPTYAKRDLREFAELLQGGTVRGYETVYLAKDGREVDLVFNAKFARDERGQIAGTHGTAYDITERKRADDALREARQRLEAVVNAAPFGAHTYELLPDDRLIFMGANLSADVILKVDHRQFIGKTIEEAFPELTGTEIPAAYRHVATTGEAYHQESNTYNEQGISGVFEVHAIQTGPQSMTAFFRDITERKQAEAALQKFAFMANAAPEFMSLVDQQGVYESVNEAYCRARGKSRQELIGRSLAEVWGESLYREKLRPNFERCFAGEIVRYEETFIFSGAELRNYQVGMYPYAEAPDFPVTHVVVVTSDITEYKQADAALRLSEQNLKKAQHFARLGSWIWNIQSNHLEWSDEMYNIFDIDKQTFSGSLPEVIAQAIHPDDRAKVEESNLSVVNEGKPIPLDYRIVKHDGTLRVVWAEAGELVRDAEGRPSLLSGTVQDITERKQMEDNLRASLVEKEALLKEVHHRVKNNLQIVSSLLSMQASNSQNELVTKALEESKNRIRAMALIHEKLYRSKNLEYIQTEEYISELLEYLSSSFAGQMENISFDLQIANLILDIGKAIPCGMIIIELVSNALKYAFPEHAPGVIQVHLTQEAGKTRLMVSDNGIGLPAETDLQHPVTLGLELVSILSHQLKAELEVTRQPGTTFTITFPA